MYTNLTDFSDRELGNLMWALAILDRRSSWVVDSVLAHAVDQFGQYNANSLHLIVWALGKLGHCPGGDWMQSFLKAAQNNFFQFTPSEMANIIWALAKLGRWWWSWWW